MGIDTGPFQDITAIEGGIFGRIAAINPKSSIVADNPLWGGGAACSTLSTVPLSWTPTPGNNSRTATTMQIFVGDYWGTGAGSSLNPFAPELSESPGATASAGIDNLASLTTTHVDSSETVGPMADEADLTLCDYLSATTYTRTYGTTSGQLFTGPGPTFDTLFGRTQYWQYSIVEGNIGNEFELWAMVFWYQDHANNPAVTTAPFWTHSVDDKLTWT